MTRLFLPPVELPQPAPLWALGISAVTACMAAVGTYPLAPVLTTTFICDQLSWACACTQLALAVNHSAWKHCLFALLRACPYPALTTAHMPAIGFGCCSHICTGGLHCLLHICLPMATSCHHIYTCCWSWLSVPQAHMPATLLLCAPLALPSLHCQLWHYLCRCTCCYTQWHH